MSSVRIQCDPLRRRFSGKTQNVARLALEVGVLEGGGPITVHLDGERLDSLDSPPAGLPLRLSREGGRWTPAVEVKGKFKRPERYGTFKDAFRNRVILVYGTHGNQEENRWALEKARFDAERFWYQGNGSLDVVSDREFNPRIDRDRNVILYGNATSNRAWDELLASCPVRVAPNLVTMGTQKTLAGDDLACVMIYPRHGSDIASVGVVAGTGIRGMRTCTKLPYLLPGVGFPDCLVIRSRILEAGEEAVESAGFFGLDWSLERGEFVGGR